jgi:drug/metabolite transporter (DMT)-like permease
MKWQKNLPNNGDQVPSLSDAGAPLSGSEPATKTTPTAARWNLWGAILIILGALLAAFSNALIHGLARPIPACQLLFLKTTLGCLLCAPLWYKYRPQIRTSPNKKWHLYKAIAGALGNVLWFMALQSLPFADATTLSLASALMTTFGAAIFFGEKIRPWTLLALTVGFVGVVITLMPSFKDVNWAALLPLGSAAFYTASSLIVKKVSIKDEMPVSLFYLLGGMAALSAPFAIAFWIPLTATEYVTTGTLAIVYVAIQWTLIEAYTYASAGFLAPFKFIRFPLGLAIGVLFFNEPATGHTLAGAVLILLGCLMIQFTRRNPSHRYKTIVEEK